jgi:GNAT superfamily N-acetyltransferase
MIAYQEISLSELKNRIAEIDVSEHGSVVYYWIENEVKPVPEEWERPKKPAAAWQSDSWNSILECPGVRAWGAIDLASNQLVAVVVYRPHLTEDMAQLAALFTDKEYRRKGIAARLTQELIRQAVEDGHSRMYVSATPSESAVNFYRSQGFVPTKEVHPELYALEPEDIHMIKKLA